MWTYLVSLWKFHNGVKYGHTKLEAIKKDITNLRNQVLHEYSLYDKDPYIISSQFQHLFLGKDLSLRLSMCRDSLQSWLHSVHEAKRHQEYLGASLRKITTFLFRPKHAKRKMHSECPAGPVSLRELEQPIIGVSQNMVPAIVAPIDSKLLLMDTDYG